MIFVKTVQFNGIWTGSRRQFCILANITPRSHIFKVFFSSKDRLMALLATKEEYSYFCLNSLQSAVYDQVDNNLRLDREAIYFKDYLTIMEEFDPILERREREALRAKEKSLKNAMMILAAVAVVLAGFLAYIWIQKSALVNDLEAEKEDLTVQMESLQQDYANLSSDYESINSQLDTSRAEVAELIERIKKTEATNRRKMRQYEKELGTLRSIMRNYIVQIDSLNTLNHKLTADAAAARREAAASRRQNAELSQQVESLSGQVAAGSVVKARGLRVEAYNSSDKVTDRSSRVVRLLTTLSLVENDLAPKGPVRVYIRVKDPDGIILTNSDRRSFTYGGETLVASASREVDYQGKEVELSIYMNDIPSYAKGIYTVEAYTEQSRLGTAELLLR